MEGSWDALVSELARLLWIVSETFGSKLLQKPNLSHLFEYMGLVTLVQILKEPAMPIFQLEKYMENVTLFIT